VTTSAIVEHFTLGLFKMENNPKRVLIAMDGSNNSEYAFKCK